jgi:hypothetical protein
MRTSVLMDRNAPVQSKTAVSYIALKLIVSGAMKPTENKEPKIHRINPFTNTGPNGIHDLSVTEVLGPAPDAVRDMGISGRNWSDSCKNIFEGRWVGIFT